MTSSSAHMSVSYTKFSLVTKCLVTELSHTNNVDVTKPHDTLNPCSVITGKYECSVNTHTELIDGITTKYHQ